MITQGRLDSLATKLGRPPGALRDLAQLSAGQLAQLEAAIDTVCERHVQQTAQALRKAFPQPLRALLLRGLR